MQNNLVSKSNQLIQMSYSLSIAEQRLLFSCLSQIDSSKDLDLSKPVELTVRQAQDLFYDGEKRYNAFIELKEACKRLYDREVRIKDDDDQTVVFTRWVHTAKFHEKEQKAVLHFTSTLAPYISSLVSNFTQYRLNTVAQLTNKYASRIYELILMWHNNDVWQAEKMNTKAKTIKEIEIDEFRFLLNLNGKYQKISALKEYVIKPCIKQINDNTDMVLSVEFKRVGRSFKYIQLAYSKKPSEKTIQPQNEPKPLPSDVINRPLTMKQAHKFAGTITAYCHKNNMTDEVHKLGATLGHFNNWYDAKDLIFSELQDESKYSKYIDVLKIIGYKQF